MKKHQECLISKQVINKTTTVV